MCDHVRVYEHGGGSDEKSGLPMDGGEQVWVVLAKVLLKPKGANLITALLVRLLL